jgi:hypothetical protein
MYLTPELAAALRTEKLGRYSPPWLSITRSHLIGSSQSMTAQNGGRMGASVQL